MSDKFEHDMREVFVREKRTYECSPIDLSAWHIVELRVPAIRRIYADAKEELAWLKGRNINYRYGTFSVQGDVGHKLMHRFYFPPEQARDAMLFKLTWGGV